MLHKLYLTRRAGFEAAHNLLGYVGDCRNLHGHSYKVEVTISGYIDTEKDHKKAENCMLLDFKKLDEAIRRTIGVYDHNYLNDFFTNPTAELMAIKIFNDLSKKLSPIKVECVKLWETENSYAEYHGEVKGHNE